MRLLDARALIHEGVSRLVDDTEIGRPHFAILSHTWGREDVLFDDIALGPTHEIDSPNAEQRAASGYRTDTRILDPSPWRPSRSSGRSRGTFQKLTRMSEENPAANEVCESCRLETQSMVAQQGAHVKAGWKKIWSVCLQACQDGYDYVWIDTCCIDKSSSSELAEALNSMFEWYAVSAICYVLLEDCKSCSHQRDGRHNSSDLHTIDDCTTAQIGHCRWLSRGWTLQELIAPTRIQFFDKDWTLLGSRVSLEHVLRSATGIDLPSLETGYGPQVYRDDRKSNLRRRLSRYPIATRMSWAADRKTTRIEDQAYCLLGLFDVQIAPLYGEGEKAFIRLQEEIIKSCDDDSIFAWEFKDIFEHERDGTQLLAPSPSHFSWLSDRHLVPVAGTRFCTSFPYTEESAIDTGFEISQKALHITRPVFRFRSDETIKFHMRDFGVTQSHSSSSEDDATEDEVGLHKNTGWMVLECFFGLDIMHPFIHIGLRLTHTYLDGKHVSAQVVSEKSIEDELPCDVRERLGMPCEYGRGYRLVLYRRDREPYGSVPRGTQSITIRRNGA